jgi:cell division septum initiation protein DivIVA
VALDRQSIARSDFPAARRGYDTGAVNRHLDAIADEVEELRRRAAGPGAPLAAQTSEQVRAIIEAAESSAAGIRDSAAHDARAHVARVAEAADALRERIDALERELTGMLGTLRGGAERLRSELDAVAEGTARLAGAASGPADAPVPPVAPTALGATLGEAAAAQPADEEVDEEPALAAVAEAPADAPPAAAEAAPAERSTDPVGARIVALQWATEGHSREETERHLAAHFDVPDRAALLEAAYSHVPKT